MSKAILEEKKQRISELYRTSDLSTSAIAQALGVSKRSVQRYKNYIGLGTPSPTRPFENRPTSHDKADLALDIIEEPRPTSQGDQALEELGRPSQDEADQALDITERPSPTRLDKQTDEEPEQINFVGGSEFKTEEPQKEEFDWECPSCGHEFNGKLSQCPKCETEFDLESYEYDYECSECGYEFNGDLKRCPSCGDKFD